MHFSRQIICLIVCGTLASCAAWQRSDDAAAAKHRMRGMTKEQVLVCMGPPRQRAHVNETEVWSYASTDGQTNSFSASHRYGDSFSFGSKDKSFCTVNIVMKNDVVATVHYNGPTGGLFTSDEQCGYAVKHCVEAD